MGMVLNLDSVGWVISRDQKEELVPFSSPNIVVFVTNSHVKHILSGSEYPTRVAQCNEAVKAVRKDRFLL